MNALVRLTRNEDMEEIPEAEQKWCLLVERMGSGMTFCTGEVFGGGEGNALADTKRVKRGGITCKACLENIQEIKSVRL